MDIGTLAPVDVSPDVSPENDGGLKLEYDGGFGGPARKGGGPMKRSKFSGEQVAFALRHVEVRSPVGI